MASDPKGAVLLSAGDGRSGALILGAVVLLLFALLPVLIHVRARMTGEDHPIDDRLGGPVLSGSTPGFVQSGQRWTFRSADMHRGTTGAETWDILSVDHRSVDRTVQRPSLPSPAAACGAWTFDLRVRPDGPVHWVGSETIHVEGGTELLCDLFEYADLSGDRILSWVAVSQPGGTIQFPGVVKQTRREVRGRRMTEWLLLSVGKPGRDTPDTAEPSGPGSVAPDPAPGPRR